MEIGAYAKINKNVYQIFDLNVLFCVNLPMMHAAEIESGTELQYLNLRDWPCSRHVYV